MGDIWILDGEICLCGVGDDLHYMVCRSQWSFLFLLGSLFLLGTSFLGFSDDGLGGVD